MSKFRSSTFFCAPSMRRLTILLCFLLVASLPALAREQSDAPDIAIIGFSSDGRYFAYEQYGYDLAAGALSTGHARALLALPDAAAQRHGAREAISRRLSVRETEALVKKLSSPKVRVTAATAPAPTADVHTRAAEDRMRFALGTKVRINRRGSGGRIEIEFASEDELNRIFEVITSRG